MRCVTWTNLIGGSNHATQGLVPKAGCVESLVFAFFDVLNSWATSVRSSPLACLRAVLRFVRFGGRERLAAHLTGNLHCPGSGGAFPVRLCATVTAGRCRAVSGVGSHCGESLATVVAGELVGHLSGFSSSSCRVVMVLPLASTRFSTLALRN